LASFFLKIRLLCTAESQDTFSALEARCVTHISGGLAALPWRHRVWAMDRFHHEMTRRMGIGEGGDWGIYPEIDALFR
jgi:hypothetical protein